MPYDRRRLDIDDIAAFRRKRLRLIALVTAIFSPIVAIEFLLILPRLEWGVGNLVLFVTLVSAWSLFQWLERRLLKRIEDEEE